MRPWARKLLKIAAVVAGSGVLLALAGTFAVRELLAQIPSYRQDLQAWVNRELGLQLSFADLDARWGWRGPELTFRDASVAAGAEPFIKARTASIGVGPLRLIAVLLAKGDIGIDRLTLEGTELTVVKTADGAYRMQGAPASAGRREVRFDVPPDLDVLVPRQPRAVSRCEPQHRLELRERRGEHAARRARCASRRRPGLRASSRAGSRSRRRASSASRTPRPSPTA